MVVREPSEQEEQYLSVVEDAADAKVALAMRYYTAGRGDVGDRHVSVHRVHAGPPVRFVATCHRSDTLKTFRVDGIMSARLDTREKFRAADDAAIDDYVRSSLDGFNAGGPVRELSFFVRNPEARWVKNNLLENMRAESAGDGTRIVVATSSLNRLARYVVSLGDAAMPESPALAAEVARIARGALGNAEGAGEERASDASSD